MQLTACPFQSAADARQHLFLFPSRFPGDGGCVSATSPGAVWQQAVLRPRGSPQPPAQHVQRGAIDTQDGWAQRALASPQARFRRQREQGPGKPLSAAPGGRNGGKREGAGCSTRHGKLWARGNNRPAPGHADQEPVANAGASLPRHWLCSPAKECSPCLSL